MTLQNRKSILAATGIIATIAMLLVSTSQGLNAIDQQAVIDEVNSKPTPRIKNAFTFILPETAVDGKHYLSVTNAGIPETTVERGASVSLPLIIQSRSDKEETINFYTTYGPQKNAAKVNPPGVDAKVTPSQITLGPKGQATINLEVRVSSGAPDGLYQQQIVGEWGGENEFLGTGINIKVGKGSVEFMHPTSEELRNE